MRRIVAALALVAAAGLLTAGAGSASPSEDAASAAKTKKRPACKRGFVRRGKRCVRKAAPTIRGGRYQGTAEGVGITMEVDTTRKTMQFFYGPGEIPTGCVTGFGQPIKENAPSGPSAPANKIPSLKVGASFTYSATRSQQDGGAFGFQETDTTTWQVTGRFPTARKVTGVLKWTSTQTGDNHPDPHYRRAARTCSRQVNFTLNAN